MGRPTLVGFPAQTTATGATHAVTGEGTLSLRVVVRTPTVETFVQRYSRFVKEDRIFIFTKTSQPPGTKLRFVLELVDGRPLLAGEGTVTRVRPDTGDNAKPPGMELTFVATDEASKKIVALMLDERLTRGPRTGSMTAPPAPAPAVLPALPLTGAHQAVDPPPKSGTRQMVAAPMAPVAPGAAAAPVVATPVVPPRRQTQAFPALATPAAPKTGESPLLRGSVSGAHKDLPARPGTLSKGYPTLVPTKPTPHTSEEKRAALARIMATPASTPAVKSQTDEDAQTNISDERKPARKPDLATIAVATVTVPEPIEVTREETPEETKEDTGIGALIAQMKIAEPRTPLANDWSVPPPDGPPEPESVQFDENTLISTKKPTHLATVALTNADVLQSSPAIALPPPPTVDTSEEVEAVEPDPPRARIATPPPVVAQPAAPVSTLDADSLFSMPEPPSSPAEFSDETVANLRKEDLSQSFPGLGEAPAFAESWRAPAADAMTPANPFSEISDNAIEYFVEWSVDRASTPLDEVNNTEPFGNTVVAADQSIDPAQAAKLAKFASLSQPTQPLPSGQKSPVGIVIIALAIGLLIGGLAMWALRGRGHQTVTTVAVPVVPAVPQAPPPVVPVPSAAPNAAADAPQANPYAPKAQMHAPKAQMDAPKAQMDAQKGQMDAPKAPIVAAATPPVTPKPAPVEQVAPPVEPKPTVAPVAAKAPAPAKRPRGVLKIFSTPEGADVLVGGDRHGKTPTQVSLPGDEVYMVELSLPGGKAWKRKVYLKTTSTTVHATLAGAPPREPKATKVSPVNRLPTKAPEIPGQRPAGFR